MTPSTYNFRIPQNRNYDHYVVYGSKKPEQHSFWQSIKKPRPLFSIESFETYSKLMISNSTQMM